MDRWIGKELKTTWGKGREIYKVGAPRGYGLFKTVRWLPPKESSLKAFVKEGKMVTGRPGEREGLHGLYAHCDWKQIAIGLPQAASSQPN